MAGVNPSRLSSSVVLVAGAAALSLALAGCGGSGSETASSKTSSLSDAIVPTVTEASTCPTAAPALDAAPQWKLAGATGSVEVIGSTDDTAPRVTVQAPFSVTETQVQTLVPGDGPVVADTATVSVCYEGVNGRDGNVFDSAYQRGAPVEFPLTNVVPGFQKAIAGQKVGSTVAVAMVPADGYPQGEPRAGIQKGDSLIFAIKILDVTG